MDKIPPARHRSHPKRVNQERTQERQSCNFSIARTHCSLIHCVVRTHPFAIPYVCQRGEHIPPLTSTSQMKWPYCVYGGVLFELNSILQLHHNTYTTQSVKHFFFVLFFGILLSRSVTENIICWQREHPK